MRSSRIFACFVDLDRDRQWRLPHDGAQAHQDVRLCRPRRIDNGEYNFFGLIVVCLLLQCRTTTPTRRLRPTEPHQDGGCKSDQRRRSIHQDDDRRRRSHLEANADRPRSNDRDQDDRSGRRSNVKTTPFQRHESRHARRTIGKTIRLEANADPSRRRSTDQDDRSTRRPIAYKT